MLCAVVFLLWSNVCVHSHAVPYVTFMGEALPNNSYLDGSLVGDPLSGGKGVQCHTDLTTCCSRHQGNDSGDWYVPNGDQLAFYSRSSGDGFTKHPHNESQSGRDLPPPPPPPPPPPTPRSGEMVPRSCARRLVRQVPFFGGN